MFKFLPKILLVQASRANQGAILPGLLFSVHAFRNSGSDFQEKKCKKSFPSNIFNFTCSDHENLYGSLYCWASCNTPYLCNARKISYLLCRGVRDWCTLSHTPSQPCRDVDFQAPIRFLYQETYNHLRVMGTWQGLITRRETLSR